MSVLAVGHYLLVACVEALPEGRLHPPNSGDVAADVVEGDGLGRR